MIVTCTKRLGVIYHLRFTMYDLQFTIKYQISSIQLLQET